MTDEQRQQRNTFLASARVATAERGNAEKTPLTSDDIDVLETLLPALQAGHQGGYSEEEKQAISDLMGHWISISWRPPEE